MAIHFFPRCFVGLPRPSWSKRYHQTPAVPIAGGQLVDRTGEQKQRKDGRLEHPKDQLALVSFCLSKQSIQICGRLFKIHSFIHSFLLATFSNNEDKFLEENPISFQVLGCLKHTNTLPAIFGGFSSQSQSLRRLGVESD